jgi:hypothetical protein
MTLGIVTLNVTIVADYIASSSKSTFPIGAMGGRSYWWFGSHPSYGCSLLVQANYLQPLRQEKK